MKTSGKGKNFIMDDESYSKLFSHQDNNYYYYENSGGTDEKVKYTRKENL